jgi:hypothetical protein
LKEEESEVSFQNALLKPLHQYTGIFCMAWMAALTDKEKFKLLFNSGL